ncbi:MAG: aminoacyl-tRNA hydrolase [Gemmatimonadaceae bacterium]|nr:aminoacyl-tRNA hydrolase [Gemmatimonadaceae bacterium]
MTAADESSASAPAAESGGLEINSTVRIAEAELLVRAMTGSGPGGQHVNRSATRIELRWNVHTSRALTDAQRQRVSAKLASRIDGDGYVRIVAGEYRSQQQNRRAARERLASVLARALMVAPTRKATRPTRASVERRLTEKRRRSDTKDRRRQDDHD